MFENNRKTFVLLDERRKLGQNNIGQASQNSFSYRKYEGKAMVGGLDESQQSGATFQPIADMKEALGRVTESFRHLDLDLNKP